MRVVVTGGAGFVGSHLVDAILASGADFVYIVDNFFTGSENNIKHHEGNPKVKVIRHDVVDAMHAELEALDPSDPAQRIDQIYHLACPASPPHYQADAVKTLLTNVMGTKNFLDLARKHKARLLLTSTSEVYGDPDIHPQVEEYRGNTSCTGIRACYDEGKRAAETLCFDYNRQRETDVCIARIFNTYGPRMNFQDGRVISNFVIQALTGSDITMYGDGSQTRSFCYVSELVDGLMRLMGCGKTGPINIGNPAEFSMLEIANLIKELVGSGVGLVFKPLPSDDPRKRRPDITKANQILGWSPVIPVADGLRRTIEDFKSRIAAGEKWN